MSADDCTVEVIEAIAESDSIEPSEADYTLSDHIDSEVLERAGDVEGGVWERTFRVSDHHVRLTHECTVFVDGVKHAADTAMLE